MALVSRKLTEVIAANGQAGYVRWTEGVVTDFKKHVFFLFFTLSVTDNPFPKLLLMTALL